jgi:hypothetical protein
MTNTFSAGAVDGPEPESAHPSGGRLGARAQDTWYTVDLPVLDVIMAFFREQPAGVLPRLSDIHEALDLPAEEIFRSAVRLEGEYLEVERIGSLSGWAIRSVTPAARRAVGQWPNPEVIANQLIAAMADAAANELDPDKRTRLQSATDVLGGVGREILISVTAAFVKAQMGLT